MGTTPAVLDYLVFYVADIERALAFYEAAFGFSVKLRHEGGDYAEMHCGGNLTLAFCHHTLAQSLFKQAYTPLHQAENPPGMQVSLLVDNVNEAYERAITAGAEPISPPQFMPWGFEVAFVRDFQGFLIELCRRVYSVAAETP